MESDDSSVFYVNVRCIHGDETIITVLSTCFGAFIEKNDAFYPYLHIILY